MTATPIEDAQVVYEPDPDFAGEDGLDYKITNPIGQAAECHVRFEVVEPIVAVDDTAETEDVTDAQLLTMVTNLTEQPWSEIDDSAPAPSMPTESVPMDTAVETQPACAITVEIVENR